MDQYLVLVYVGLTGSVTMITCTILALTRMVYEYKGGSTELGSILPVRLSNYGQTASVCCFLSPRCHRRGHQGAAAVQHLPADVISY